MNTEYIRYLRSQGLLPSQGGRLPDPGTDIPWQDLRHEPVQFGSQSGEMATQYGVTCRVDPPAGGLALNDIILQGPKDVVDQVIAAGTADLNYMFRPGLYKVDIDFVGSALVTNIHLLTFRFNPIRAWTSATTPFRGASLPAVWYHRGNATTILTPVIHRRIWCPEPWAFWVIAQSGFADAIVFQLIISIEPLLTLDQVKGGESVSPSY